MERGNQKSKKKSRQYALISTVNTIVAVKWHKCLLIYLRTDIVPREQKSYFLRNDSAKCHNLGHGDSEVGSMNPKFKLGRDFCTMQLASKFHHPMFNRLEVIVSTNKQCEW